MNKTLFISAGPIEWGSSRMRVWWVSEEMEDAQVGVTDGNSIEVPTDFDTYIFQKNGYPDLQKKLIDAGKKVYLDHCDPMWWFSNQDYMRRVSDNSHGAAFCTTALEQDFIKWYSNPLYKTTVIPDGLKGSHFPKRRIHVDISPVRFIWYGLYVNRVALAGAWANLCRLKANGHNISLTIFDDRPDIPLSFGNEIPILYAKWNLEHENAQIAGHDIALLPPYPGPWGKVKSDNKAMTANICGLPVTDGWDYGELVDLMCHKKRSATYPYDYYGVEYSARLWQEFIND